MCSEADVAVRVTGLCKRFVLYERPLDRLMQLFGFGRNAAGRDFHALHDANFEIRCGEVVGIVGRNGAGKSTLLQLICGTLQPTAGTVHVQGRTAALLELGAGFNPDFTGRENIYFNGSLLGLAAAEIDERLDGIIAFADIGDFIDQPVRTYSSGMFVRLAFAVATSVDPDILVIDEALSVGDGAFARKSFDRVMAMRDAGKTILFCSHSLYQVEVLCNRVLWLDKGIVRAMGPAAEVIPAYEAALAAQAVDSKTAVKEEKPVLREPPQGHARIVEVTVMADGLLGRELQVRSLQTEIRIEIGFVSDPLLPVPSVAVGFLNEAGETVASAGSTNDGIVVNRDADGSGRMRVSFPKIPLLKGNYTVTAVLACEEALYFYEVVQQVATLRVTQEGFEKGVVSLPHRWEVPS